MMDEMEQKICALVDARKDEIIAFAQDPWTHAISHAMDSNGRTVL